MKLTITYTGGQLEEHAIVSEVEDVRVTPKGECGIITATMEVPLRDIHDVWMVNFSTGGTEGIMPWYRANTFGAQCGFPFCALMNFGGISRLSFGSSDIVDDTRIRLAVNQEKCIYELTMEVAVSTENAPFDVRVDRRSLPWQQALKEWQASLNIPAYTYPEDAYEPVFCTWYVTHAAVDAKIVEELSKEAVKFGFRTLIVDDGWCYDEWKRVSPKTIKDWYAPIGDWKISTAKFPDFKAHVQRVKAMGMKYLLWVAPFLAGRDSAFRAQHDDWMMPSPAEEHEGTRYLDVTTADTTDMIDNLCRLAKENNLDGLKIDFLDIVKPDVSSPNSRKTEAFIRDITNGLKRDNPSAMIEFRQNYINMAMLPYGTQFRAGDAPFDWMLNFSRIAEIRLSIGSRAPVHADPAYWGPEETIANVARHMMALCAGVPMISMSLQDLCEEQRDTIKFYIDFYNRHKDVINHGDWNVLCSRRVIDGAIVEKDGCRIVYLANDARLDEALANAPKKTVILNMSEKCIAVENAKVFTATGKPGKDGYAFTGEMCVLK